MTRRQKRIHPNIAAFFTGAAVVFDREVGYQDVIDGIVHIGGEKPDDTIHEMCHFVEIDEARMDKPIWGMNFGIWVPTPGNRYSCGFHEYFGTADIEREMRVIAWHANVAEAIDVNPNLNTWIRALSFVPGWQNLTMKESQKALFVRKTITAHRTEHRFSYENFVREWSRRNNILNKQKTKKAA